MLFMETNKLNRMRLLLIILLLPFIGLSQSRDTIVLGPGGSGGNIDTNNLSNRINQKVNISDTLNMLSGYLRVGQGTGLPDTIAKIGAQRASVLADNNTYAQSPIAFQTSDGWGYVCINESATHISTGEISLTRSKDGSNWADPWPVTVPGFDTLGVPAWGVYGNKIIVRFMRVVNQIPDYTKIFTATYTVVGNDIPDQFTLTDSIGLFGGQVQQFPMGT
jgi:hypothetical protein